jgi:hypothetical protein
MRFGLQPANKPLLVTAHLRMHLRFALLFVCVALIVPVEFAQEQHAPTVDELVAKNIQAKGGATALRALQSLRLTGKMLVNQGQIELRYVETKARPSKIRIDATLQGMTAVNAYDGKDGWKISPFQGRKDPEKMSTDDVKPLMEDADIDGPLVDWKSKGSTVEYLGTEDVDGTPAHKLKVVRKKSCPQKRRCQFCLSRSGSLFRDPDSDPTTATWRTGRGGDRTRRLRAGQHRFCSLRNRLRTQGRSGQTKSDHRQSRGKLAG